MEKYDDIINLPHHVSKKHPQMSLHDRAAQFAPFAALTGYDEEVKEVSRITGQFHPLESKKKEEINQKLCILQEIQYEHPLISICYFVPDKRKAGGSEPVHHQSRRHPAVDHAHRVLPRVDNGLYRGQISCQHLRRALSVGTHIVL